MKQAIYLIGNVGSGKDFLLRNTPLKSLKEIHNDRLCELYNSGHRLSDNRIVVNCSGEELGPLLKSKQLLESSGYKTMGVFVFTTDEVSRVRNEARRKPGSRIINESLRAAKYKKSLGNVAHLAKAFHESFLIYNNSYSEITYEVKGWLEELSEELSSFLSEHEPPESENISGSQDRGHGENHEVGGARERLNGGEVTAGGTHPRDVTDTVGDNESDNNGKLATETFDANKAHAWAKRMRDRLRRRHTKHMKDSGTPDHPNLLTNSYIPTKSNKLNKSKQDRAPDSQVGNQDGGAGMTASGDQAVNEFFDSGIRHPVSTVQQGKSPSTPLGMLGGKTSLGGYNWAGSLSVLPDATEEPANLGPEEDNDGRSTEGGALSGGGVPGAAQNEARKYKSKPNPNIDGSDDIGGSPDGGGAQLLSATGTVSEALRSKKNKIAKVYRKQAQKRANKRENING